MILIPIATRYISPVEYGILATSQAVASLFFLLCFMSLQDPLYLEAVKHRDSVDRFAATAVTLQLLLLGTSVALALAVGAFVGSEAFFGVPFMPNQFTALLGTLVGIFPLTYLQFLQARDRVREFVLLSLGMSVLPIALTILFLTVYRMQSMGFLLATLAGNALAAVYVIAVLLRPCGLILDRTLAIQMLRTSIPLVPHNLAYWIRTAVNRLLLAKYMGTAEAGLFHVANQLASVLLLGIEPFRSANNPRFFRLVGMGADPQRITGILPVSLGVFALLGLGLSLWAREAFLLVAGANFQAAHVLIPFHCTAFLLVLFYYNLVNVLYLHKRGWLLSISSISAGALSILASFLLVKTMGLWGACVAFVVANGVTTGAILVSSQRTQPLPWAVGKSFILTLLPLSTYAVERGTTLAPFAIRGLFFLGGVLTVAILVARELRQQLSPPVPVAEPPPPSGNDPSSR